MTGTKRAARAERRASSPPPRCSRRSLCSNSILGDGHVYVHVHVHVCIRLRVQRIMGTKRAARAERCFSLSFPYPSLPSPFSLFKYLSGTLTFTGE